MAHPAGADSSRRPAGRIRLTVECAGTSAIGSVYDTSAGRVSVALPADDAPALPLGAPARLVFAGGPLPAPVAVNGTLRSRVETPEHRRYGFQLDAASPIGAVSATSTGDPDRRRSLRLRPPTETPIPVTLTPVSEGELVSGSLWDLSTGGLAVLVPLAAERVLVGSVRVQCLAHLPGREGPETFACLIRNRIVAPDGIRYGMAFDDHPSDHGLGVPPTYEPLWDCSGGCGSRGLLAESQVWCPRCGTPRAQSATYFPSWTALAERSTHPFTGADRVCPGCGAAWSLQARHCGRCGSSLA